MATRTASRKPVSSAVRQQLDRHQLVDRALQLADHESLEAVTIRRLAAEFSVTPMALYWHFENKEALLAAMGDEFYGDLDLERLADSREAWDDRLRAVLDQLLAALRRHPASVSLATPRIMQCESGLQLTELTLRLLHDAGFSVQESADIARTALQTVLMLVSAMPGGEFGVAADERDAVLAGKRNAIAALPDADYPLLRQSVDALTACEDTEAYFGYGLDLFLAGVRARHSTLSSTAG